MKIFPPYGLLAEFYNQSMDLVPYQDWAEFLSKELQGKKGIAMDIGCGTGRFLEAFIPLSSYEGYYCIDQSQPMLKKFQDFVAKNQANLKNSLGQAVDLVWILGKWGSARLDKILNKIQQGGLEGKLDCILCTHTTINYFQDIDQFIQKCRFFLKPGGHLFFDMVSLRNIQENYIQTQLDEVCSGQRISWRSYWYPEKNLLKVHLNFIHSSSQKPFAKEIHNQYYHPLKPTIQALLSCGFGKIQVGGDYQEWFRKKKRIHPEPYLYNLLAQKKSNPRRSP